jgi:hypothetical protein
MFSLVVPRKGNRAHTNVTAGSVIAQLASYNKNRKSITFQNQGAATVFIGDATVTATGSTTGYSLFAGTTFTDNASDGAWYVIMASGNANINVIEVT